MQRSHTNGLWLILGLVTVLVLLARISSPDAQSSPASGAATVDAPRVQVRTAAEAIAADAGFAAAGDRRQVLDRPPSRELRVVDAQNGAPIAGATIRSCAGAAAPHEWRTAHTDGAGVAVCDASGSAAVFAVTAPGWAPKIESCDAGTEPLTVAMERGAVLRFRFVGRDGQPVPEVAVRLLAPLHSGPEWGSDWRATSEPAAWEDAFVGAPDGDLPARAARGIRVGEARELVLAADCLRDELTRPCVSDATGTIELSDLPAGRGWRWGRVSEQIVDMTPPHETSPLQVEDGRLRATSARRIGDLSGALTLAAGETRELTIRVYDAGCVIGRLPAVGAALRAQVKLFHVSQSDPASKTRAIDVSMEAFVAADDDGYFRFDGVRPGAKLVRAYWRTSPVDYVFATAVGQLADHAVVDLGLIRPLPGELTVRVDLLDRERRAVPLTDVLESAEPQAMLCLTAQTASRSLAESISEILRVPLATDLRLHGLECDELRLRSACNPEWPAPGPKHRLFDSPGVVLRAPLPQTAFVPLTLETRLEREVTIVTPAAARPDIDLWLRPLRDGAAERLRVPGGEGAAAVHLLPLAEPYELLACARDAVVGGDVLVGMATVDFATAAAATLSLASGSTVRGRCRSAAGEPLANRQLLWTRPGFTSGKSRFWMFAARTDAEGRFAIAGLPPGQELLGSRPGTTFLAPAAGGIAEVEFVLQR